MPAGKTATAIVWTIFSGIFLIRIQRPKVANIRGVLLGVYYVIGQYGWVMLLGVSIFSLNSLNMDTKILQCHHV